MIRDRIISKQFSRAFLGYDVEEVDAFLDEIVREIERMNQQLDLDNLRIKLMLEELSRNGLLETGRDESGNLPEADFSADNAQPGINKPLPPDAAATDEGAFAYQEGLKRPDLEQWRSAPSTRAADSADPSADVCDEETIEDILARLDGDMPSAGMARERQREASAIPETLEDILAKLDGCESSDDGRL